MTTHELDPWTDQELARLRAAHQATRLGQTIGLSDAWMATGYVGVVAGLDGRARLRGLARGILVHLATRLAVGAGGHDQDLAHVLELATSWPPPAPLDLEMALVALWEVTA
jgi:hypothetical protein